MKIYLPNAAFLGNMGTFLKQIDLSDPDSLEITSHPKWTFVHPVVLSMIGALGLTVKPENIVHKIEAKSRHYFERMGLFKMWGIPSGMIITAHEESGRFIPLTRIRVEGELSEVIANINPLLHLTDFPEQAETMRYVIYEIARNVIEHAEAEYGGIICAQYYKDSNKIRIGIADAGIGIRTTIRRFHQANTHADAIRLALRPGITGTTHKPTGTAQNAGAGLFFTKSIARVNQDYFWIYTGDSAYKLLPKQKEKLIIPHDPFDDRHSLEEGLPFWKGTVVGIDITLDQTIPFQELLKYLRRVLAEAVKERKKIVYKKPRFE